MKKNIQCAVALFALTTFIQSTAIALPTKKVDLRTKITSFNIPIKTQGSRNTCSVYATTFLLEYETAKASNQPGIDFSEDYLNAVTDIVKGAKDDGDFFNNILSGYLKFGIVDESDFPTSTTTYSPFKLPSEALEQDGKNNVKFVPVYIREIPASGNPWGLTDENINQIIAQLDAGRPVAAGWALSSSIENTQVLGVNAWSKNIVRTRDGFYGHSMAIVGYAGSPSEGGYFIIRNSGSADWGDKGYWYCTFDFAKHNIADVFYFTPRRRELSLRMPVLIKTPVPRYVQLNALRQIPTVMQPQNNLIILQKPGAKN